jgi:homogentisate 1,2-dioxygenase
VTNRCANLYFITSWLYRVRPSVAHVPFKKIDNRGLDTESVCNAEESADENKIFLERIFIYLLQQVVDPNQLRWKPFGLPTQETDFVQGLRTIAHAGHSTVKHGIAIRIRSLVNKEMLLFDSYRHLYCQHVYAEQIVL